MKMKISSWAVKRPISVFMSMAVILLLGGVSLSKLSIDLLPKMNVPVAVVSTQYLGAGPFEVENMVTKPIEQAMATVHNLKRISSSSCEGISIVTIEFNQGIDMDFATLQMREKIDLIKGFLPEETTEPIVLKIDPNAMPIMVLGISGYDDLSKIQQVAEYQIKPRLERLPGVASIAISGGYERIVQIKIDIDRLSANKITMEQLATLLRAENINLPGGEIIEGNEKILIRTTGEFESIDEIKYLPIMLPSGKKVTLSDLANVELTYKEIDQIAKVDGKGSIRMTIQKQSVSNTVQVSNLINKEIDVLQNELQDIGIEPIIDQSKFIKGAIINVGITALYGAILASIILYLFMGNIRTTLVIAVAIPISIIATFTLMYFSGLTLNLLSLGGFALGVGMLVDNGIVVLENIYRYKEDGYSAFDAAIRGAKEVSLSVSAATFTTVSVFLPIAFVEGITAEIFKELALTVSFSLLASLVISLTLVPMLCSKLFKNEEQKFLRKNRVLLLFNNFFNICNEKYSRVLQWSLLHRKIIIFTTLIIFLATLSSAFFIGVEFFPNFDDGSFTVDIRLPYGVMLEETEEIANEVENILKENSDIERIFTSIGGGDGDLNIYGTRSNFATVDGKLVSYKRRNNSTDEIIDGIRNRLAQIPGATISISTISSTMGFGTGGADVGLEIRGEDLEILQSISKDIINIVESVDGTREVKSNFIDGRPQMEVKLKRDVASTYGLTTAYVASNIRNILSGITATRFRLEGRDVNVILTGEDYLKNSLSSFRLINIQTPVGVNIPLDQIAEIQYSQAPSTVRRTDQVRGITVSASTFNRDLKSVIVDIKEQLEEYRFPNGYTYEFRGQKEQLDEAYKSLTLAVILAVFLVYMIMASQFQSLLYPFIIMLSVPLAFTGGVIGLFLAKLPISVPAAIGAIVLSGIVVNNGIVLIDYINILRSRGKEKKEAIILSGRTRLRPILMTTLTTVLGLIPLALATGDGAEIQAPLAIVVIGGLTLSTLLTLIVIPVIYSLIDDAKP